MLDQLYFSVVEHCAPANPSKTKARIPFLDTLRKRLTSFYDDLSVWGIWDIYPSDDMGRPPILSGAARSKAEVSSIAKQYGLDDKIAYDNEHHCNQILYRLASYEGALISRKKIGGGKYAIGVWSSSLEYLLGAEPVYIQEKADEAETLAVNLEYSNGSPYVSWSRARYISNYIRKRQAVRKLGAIPSGASDVALVDFVYADHLKSYMRCLQTACSGR